MRQLPKGTVTFLFTDIEGSTRLIEELGEEGYVEALAEHRRLLREAFAAHHGLEVDTQGDAFLYAFADPAEALAAAADGQSALATAPVKVRIGLHTGEPRLTGEGYAGRELHRAARIAASAHGGQVVVSAATRALVDGELAELGEHRLKNFSEPVPLYQLGDEAFPPLKTVSNTNLPRPASSFVGRERELAELVSMLQDGARLVTLSGPGGSGKTRLALETAIELVSAFKAGVFWIGLANLRDPALVPETIAQTLGAKDGLAAHIEERELLLLLDNLEQVVEVAPELSQLLEACPNLKLLVTSRELLRVKGEIEYPVPPLQEPDAIDLFCERSRLEPSETIAELCRRLDELPLAIELAAARTSVLSPAQILERLSQRLDLLKGTRDAHERQQTLRATLEWSHDLLSDDEQRLFARLAVFRGGCTLEAAEEVARAELDTLQSLVDKSLVRHTDERFWMLETIREYARERLAESEEEAELRRRHGLLVLDFAEATFRAMEEGGDQVELLARMASEHHNLRAALEWTRDSGEDELLLRLVIAAAYYWGIRHFFQDLDTWLALALERREWSPIELQMEVLREGVIRAMSTGDRAGRGVLIAEWRHLAEQAGDEFQVLRAMNSAALNASDQGDLDEARAQFIAIMTRAREIGALNLVASANVNLAGVAFRSGEFQASLEHAAEAAELFRELRDDGGTFTSLSSCGWSALALSDPARAAASFRDALLIASKLGARRGFFVNVSGFAAALVAVHQEERGVQIFGAAASLRAELTFGHDDEKEERVCNRAVADARAALGEEAFAAAWARGQAMTQEAIVAFCTAPTDTNGG